MDKKEENCKKKESIHIEVIKQDNGKQRGRSSHTQSETRTGAALTPRCSQTKTPTFKLVKF